VVEQRRPKGARGGIATFFRTQFKVEASGGNEYGQLTKLVLPNSQRINVVNVYIPPTSSLALRDITEAQATTLLAEVMDLVQPQLTTLVCGDFNARVGTRVPLLDHTHPTRTVFDTHVCSRANWFI
jgi:hypothetical protein